MALTLVESAKIALGKNLVAEAAMMELYAQNSDILLNLPFDTISGNAYSFNREKILPRAEYRAVNEAYTEGTGQLENVTERLCIAGGDLDVDKFIIDTSGMDQRAVQETLKVKAISLKLTKDIIKGSILTDPKSFDGLQVRLNETNVTLLAAGATANGTPLSLVKLDELVDLVEDPSAFLMNKQMRRRLTAAARTTTVGGYITYAQDEFGRKVTQYNDLPILIVDKDETNTNIMAFDEACTSGTATGTSIYCCSFINDGVVGLQNGDMSVRDLGEVDEKPVFRTRIEWYISLAVKRPRAAARMYSISDAAVTA